MKVGPFELTLRTKANPPLSPLSTRSTWWPWVHEPYTGAWQQNVVVAVEDVITHPTAWACMTLIASDIGKLPVRLVEQDADGIWTEVTQPSPFWPVLRKPNHYQTRIEFFENWMLSKLTRGNTYVLKERDLRGVVTAMHVLDPGRVTVLVAPDQSVFYQLKRDDLSGLPRDEVIVPASEIIHDRGPSFYHPLIGVSPIYASGQAAYQALKIQSSQTNLFNKGIHPGGIIELPGELTQPVASRLKAHFDNYAGDGSHAGTMMILSDGMVFKQSTMTAVDTDLIKQLNWADEKICSTFHVPGFLIGVGEQPPYNNIQSLWQIYYQQCLQIHIEEIELLLDEGLGTLTAEKPKGTEFDIENLLRMDSQAQMTTLQVGVGAGILAPNEARKSLNKKPVKGGESPMLQQQNYSLEALADRDADAPFAKPAPAPVAAAPVEPDDEEDDEDADMTVNFLSALHTKAIAEGLYDA